MHKERETCAYKNYALRRITAYNAEVNGNVRLGRLNKNRQIK